MGTINPVEPMDPGYIYKCQIIQNKGTGVYFYNIQ